MIADRTRFGWPFERWERAKEEIFSILTRQAVNHEPVFYADLARQVTAIQLEPHDYGMAAILGEVSREEDANGRGMLSVLVVNRDTSIPGPGFFKLARKLGRDVSDEFACWKQEFEQVCSYWQRRAGQQRA